MAILKYVYSAPERVQRQRNPMLSIWQGVAEPHVLNANSEKMLTCAIRPSVILGPKSRYGPGDYQLVPQIHDCIAKGETPFIIGTGTNLYDFTFVTNIADAHVLAIENLLTTATAAGEAFFISNQEPVPFRDFMLAIWREFGHVPPFQVRIPGNLAWLAGLIAEWVAWLTGTSAKATLSRGSVQDATGTRYASGEKARHLLGYHPRVGLQEGIRIACLVSWKRRQKSVRTLCANISEDYKQRLKGSG
jgi:sterol-4alpha-carboxylate 3-dehydrogenase (decarboxylating)